MDIVAMKLRMMKRVFFPPEVCVGNGSVERLSCLDAARVMVVSGASARNNGSLDRVTAQLKGASGIRTMELPAGEPRAAAIVNFKDAVAEFGPQWIVAVGGGAVLDGAKFLWAQYEYPELMLSGPAPTTIGPLRLKARFIAIPTTAGSGSESSQAAVLSGEDGAKIPYVSPHWVPDIVILDPSLMLSLPRETTITTGFDAVAHAVEAAVSSLGNSVVRTMSATSIGLSLRHLPVAVENPQDMAAREGLLEAAFLGGLCQSAASTGAAHALSHATSKVFGTAHGAATGFYLLHTMRWNHRKHPATYDELAAGCGLAGGAGLIAAVTELACRVGLATRYTDLMRRTPTREEQASIADAASKDVCLRTNACRLNKQDLVQLLAEIE